MQLKLIFKYKSTAVHVITRPLKSICEVIVIYYIRKVWKSLLFENLYVSYKSDVLFALPGRGKQWEA